MQTLQLIAYLTVLTLLSYPLGVWMARVFKGETHFLSRALGPLEALIYRICGINCSQGMSAKQYGWSLFWFNFIGLVFVFLLQLLQSFWPLNPAQLPAVSWHSAFNTAVSFVTNTNWQGYAGESTMSYLTQMLGLGAQNFLSAATGVAVFLALTRGLIGRQVETIGNFWVDIVRSTLYVFIPLSALLAFVLMSQGVVQTFQGPVEIQTLEGAKQVLPLGPAASQIAIKQLGTNGGGFFNANSSHPFENPTPLSNFLEMLAILLLPSALVFTFGKLVGSQKQALLLWSVMLGVWLAGLSLSIWSESLQNPTLGNAIVQEGKETRFGMINSLIWATSTTVASNGSVNAMHSSLSPLTGAIAMLNMMFGEVIFGGVGAGLYGMILFVLMTVFLSGLMVGRSPEYLGKKVEGSEIKWALMGILAPCATILIGAASALVTPWGLESVLNKGPHAFSEILYAFTSAAANNGSAFAGLNANTPFYNLGLGLAMLVGRYSVIFPCLAIAGLMARKKISPPNLGTFATDSPLFGFLLTGVIVIVGALTFLPALTLGPIVEHLLMLSGHGF